jgi:hypothetical protein
MKVTTGVSGMEGMDAEALLAAQSIKDAGEDRRQARLNRRQAQKDRVQLMKRAADKLRDIADNTIVKGVLNCVTCVVSMAAQANGAAGGSGVAGGAQQAGVGAAGGEALTALSQALKFVNALDPLGIRNADLQADKQMLETKAEVASQRVQEATDNVNEAQRAQSSMTQLMEKVSETRNNVRMTALKG